MLRRSQALCYGALGIRAGSSSETLDFTRDLEPMVPSNDLLKKPAKLRDRLDRDGYLYFSRIVAREQVVAAATEVEGMMMANRWSTEELQKREIDRHGVCWGIPAPEVSRAHPLPAPTHPFRISDSARDAFCGPSVMAVIRTVFGGGVHRLPHYALELSYPGEQHGFSMPAVHMNRGTKLALNAWVPLLDVPVTGGGLIAVGGSNSAKEYEKVRLTYGSHEVESGDIRGDGTFTSDPQELLRYGKRLHCTSFEAGDLVLSTVYTMQGFATNTTRHWRVSATSRWIMEGDDVGPDPRYTAKGDALGAWEAARDDPQRYPRTMEQAKKDWGLSFDA
jgi:hypothetical protein